jgi:hypothetical protein
LRLEPRFLCQLGLESGFLCSLFLGLIQFSLHGPSVLLDTLIIRFRLIEKQRIV